MEEGVKVGVAGDYKTPFKAWETFRRVIMKAFGTLRRVHNPCAEVPLIVKLGKWFDNEKHIAHKKKRDRNNIYVQEAKGWRQFQWSEKEGQYADSGQ